MEQRSEKLRDSKRRLVMFERTKTKIKPLALNSLWKKTLWCVKGGKCLVCHCLKYKESLMNGVCIYSLMSWIWEKSSRAISSWPATPHLPQYRSMHCPSPSRSAILWHVLRQVRFSLSCISSSFEVTCHLLPFISSSRTDGITDFHCQSFSSNC